ncbi:unnamed protein product [Closterium sp. NIES-53]
MRNMCIRFLSRPGDHFPHSFTSMANTCLRYRVITTPTFPISSHTVPPPPPTPHFSPHSLTSIENTCLRCRVTTPTDHRCSSVHSSPTAPSSSTTPPIIPHTFPAPPSPPPPPPPSAADVAAASLASRSAAVPGDWRRSAEMDAQI